MTTPRSGHQHPPDNYESSDLPVHVHSRERERALVREIDRLRNQVRRLEHRAKAAEKRLNSTLESITDSFYALDREWRFTYLNGEAERILRRKREDLIGKVVWDEFPSVVGTTWEREYRRAMREKRTIQFEEFFPSIGRWLSVHAYPSSDGLAIYFSDVTALHQVVDALRASEARYRALFDTGLNAVLLLDNTGRVASANAAATTMLGFAAETLFSMPPFRFIDSSDPRLFVALQTRYRVGHFHGVLNLWRGDGTTFPAEVDIRTFSDEAGKIWQSVLIRDITMEHRSAAIERFLVESGRLLAASLEPDELVGALARRVIPILADFATVDLTDAEGGYQRVAIAHRDPAFEELLRQTPCISAPRFPPRIFLATRTTNSSILLDDPDPTLLTSRPEYEECRQVLEQLAPRSILTLPLRARGQTLGVLTLATVRADRHYDRIDLAAAETLAYSAALAISNARLYQESRQAIKIRDEVLAVVSHDLRNPLHTIGLSTELMAQFLPRGIQEYDAIQHQIEIIQRSAARATHLIQDLLDVATIQAGGIKLERSITPTNPLLEDALALHRNLAEKHGITISLEAPPDLPPLNADHERLLQVFSNLIGNSIKFTRPGGTITLSAIATEDGMVRFAVADTGSGIRDEDMKRLFDPFWQAAKGKGGVGLGLPIAQGIVAAHDGEIWAESTLGRGTTIYFTIPTAYHHPVSDHE